MMIKIVMAVLACALWICSVIIVKKETEARVFRDMMQNITIKVVNAVKDMEKNGDGEN